ncbi:Polysaccharide deacetylase OS=Streptomyces alboniger OX=132473 GN=CP975_28100 PE=4 SV=1 [Streptomyces alboniger]
MRADMERAFEAFRTAGGERPPRTSASPAAATSSGPCAQALARGGVTAVQWDVVSGDAFATDPAAVARQVLEGVRPGSVVVMHCTRSAATATERALRTSVPEHRTRGYRFVRVSEQIGSAGPRS